MSWSVALLFGIQAAVLPKLEIHQYTLDNDLVVILNPDANVSDVTVHLRYGVGAMNDPKRRSGLAHLLEHMMFQETKHLGVNEFNRRMEAAGATNMNALTTFDHTDYFETIPPEALELALYLESERMGFFAAGRAEDRLSAQKKVVMNERYQRLYDTAYGQTEREIYKLIYPKHHPLRYTVIGRKKHFMSSTQEDLLRHQRSYYQPSNCTLVVSGAFDTDQTRALIEKYFGSFPRQEALPKADVDPPRIARKAISAPERISRYLRLTLLWSGPPRFSEEATDLEIFAYILDSGQSTRAWVVNLTDASIEGMTAALLPVPEGTLFRIDAIVTPGMSSNLAKTRVEAMLRTYLNHAPRKKMLAAAKKRLETQLLRMLQTSRGRAGMLHELQAAFGKADALAQYEEQWQTTSPIRLQRVVARYLNHDMLVAIAQPIGGDR